MNYYWSDLRRQLRETKYMPSTWRAHEYQLFFEIESLMYLHEILVPETESRFSQQTWSLVSGYHVPEIINTYPDSKEVIINARERIEYVKTSTAWKFWLAWYKRQADSIRLYQFSDDDHFEQREGVLLRQERIEKYEQFFFHPIHEMGQHHQPVAIDGSYYFEIDNIEHKVIIPPSFTEYAATEIPRRQIKIQNKKTSIKINLSSLAQSAIELDNKEHALNFKKPYHWQERLRSLAFLVEADKDQIQQTDQLTIDGLFNLVGALGVGKSTIIWLLVYHLTHVEKCQISVIMNTVVEAFQFARWLRLMGIKATPALGNNRNDHARKVGFANPDIFDSQAVFYENLADEPLFRWMPKPCALGALGNLSIPVGQEPCHHLYDHTNKKHQCPLLRVCSVHQMPRDLADSQVWILTPASFIFSRAPENIGQRPMYLSEAVYHLSDLLIIDEADRVQTNWDHLFAPTSLVLGSDDAILDWLHKQLGIITSGSNRSNASRSIINRLTNTDDQSNMLANRVYRLLSYGRKRKLVKWIEHQQLTNQSLFGHVLTRLIKSFPRNMSDDEKNNRREILRKNFESFWKNPLTRENEFLADWLNEFLGGDKLEHQLRKDLDNWLMKQMGWKKINSKHQILCRKLELAITLTALIKRINDIIYQLPWAESELNMKVPSQTPSIPAHFLAILPEPPIGSVLGLRAIQSATNKQHTFHAMRYHGVGRWLLLNFHVLYKDKIGHNGPHVLLTSATSWLPKSIHFHIAKRPQAILINADKKAISTVDIRFHPIKIEGKPVRVSGTSEYKEDNLRVIVHKLAKGTAHSPSDLERELMYWKKQGKVRRILLVVNSYEQANWVIDELKKFERWQGHSLRLFPDDTDIIQQQGIRTREVENFYQHDVDILVAPLMAIQRGFNILDELGDALLGTAFFLVRPFPPPDDITPQIMSLNAWYLNQLEENGRVIKPHYGTTLSAVANLRKVAHKQWIKRLATRKYLSSLSEEDYQEFLADSFVMIWQTIGRMIRADSSAKIIFTDVAFGDTQGNGKRHILHNWHQLLKRIHQTESVFEKQLAIELYGIAWKAFDTAVKERKI